MVRTDPHWHVTAWSVVHGLGASASPRSRLGGCKFPNLLNRHLHFIEVGGKGRVGCMILENKASL